MNFEKQSTFKKQNGTIALVVALAFTGLFHKAGIGINLGIFTLVVLLAFWATFTTRFKERPILANSLAVIISAISVAYYGTWETILWCFLSLSVMSHLLFFPGKSLLFFETKLIYNVMGSTSAWLKAQKAPKSTPNGSESDEVGEASSWRQNIRKMFFVIVVPAIFVALFIAFYRTLNPIFDAKAGLFFHWLDFSILLTAIVGGLLAVYFFYPEYPEEINTITSSWPNTFSRENTVPLTNNMRTIHQSGIAIFAALNLTLLLFIITDLAFVSTLTSAKGINYSAYVHGGVDMLIISIVIASALVLYFFKGPELALQPTHTPLKIMALLWIALNIGLVGTTAIKNFIYIDNQGLTLKRIGVFIYLVLACSGLVLVFIKVVLRKTNAYLFRQLYVVFYAVLTLNLPIDWSSIITRSNIARNVAGTLKLEYTYMLQLDNRVLPLFAENWNALNVPEGKREHFEKCYAESMQPFLQEKPTWREGVVARKQAQSRLLAVNPTFLNK